jgi:hypothetical protein
MCAEHRRGARRNLVELVHEHSAKVAQAVDDVTIVDNLMADIDRSPIVFERSLDDVNRPDHAGAKTARIRKQHCKRSWNCSGLVVLHAFSSSEVGFALHAIPPTAVRQKD